MIHGFTLIKHKIPALASTHRVIILNGVHMLYSNCVTGQIIILFLHQKEKKQIKCDERCHILYVEMEILYFCQIHIFLSYLLTAVEIKFLPQVLPSLCSCFPYINTSHFFSCVTVTLTISSVSSY